MAMAFVMRIEGTVRGHPSEYAGTYVREYDPRAADVLHPGGLLEVTKDPARARRFVSHEAALRYWRQDGGRKRADGKPDRPLTAFTVMLVPAP